MISVSFAFKFLLVFNFLYTTNTVKCGDSSDNVNLCSNTLINICNVSAYVEANVPCIAAEPKHLSTDVSSIFLQTQVHRCNSSFCNTYFIQDSDFGDSIGVQRMVHKILSSCPSLRSFSIRKVVGIGEPWHQGVEDNSYLENLDLGGNGLTSIGGRYFPYFPNLRYLRLSDNVISIIDRYAFYGIGPIVFLYLDQNNIANISTDQFQSLYHLKVLNLSGNSLDQLQQASFRNLSFLEYLCISKNDIRIIEQRIFIGYDSLLELDLSGNNIEDLGSDTFTGLIKVTTLKLNKNSIKDIQPGVFHDMRSLENLDLSSNSLDTLSADTFSKGNVALTNLDLSRNHVKILQPRCFLHLPLKELNLEHNELKTFSSEYMNKGSVLVKLNLFHNALTRLDKYMSFYAVDLLLGRNRLTYLPESWYKSRYLRQISLSHNPWQCKCLTAMHRHLGMKIIDDPIRRDGKHPTCINLDNNVCIEDDNIISTFKDIIENL